MRRGFLWLVLLIAWPPVALATGGPVLVLGDSLSAAYGIRSDDGWVNLLRKRLAEAAPAREVVNASISGETTAGGLARLPKLLAEHEPAVLVVELGANDALRGLPIAAPRENLARIITLGNDAGARVLLLGIEIPVNYGPQYRDALRAMYRDLARDFNLPLVPFLLDGVALDPELMQADGLHPTAAAQPTLLDNVWPALEAALRK
ncbi:MAG TPA: arylesterase [Dokdonella sp.]|uniref:arylesterase n=1 Tax=Dokdonella sp. TaxID=2291710 RepID=UPI0025BAAEEF|nr:arylesterase [Dokdonella sp.]MBX3690791.1 arylesterase [Dokdonella sp.]MCW5566626.1 arylesterase [Dokdonella sp.]HNR91695.1 arylesterase [Dokdonella sp.]